MSAIALVRARFAKALWACYPLVVFFAIVVTGNHFWLDAAAGALVASAALFSPPHFPPLPPALFPSRDAPPQTPPYPADPHTPIPPRAIPPPAPRPLRSYARNRLIESRLTPNAISMTGLVLNLAAAGLVLGERFFLGGIAFIVGSVMDTLDGRYSRMSGKGTLFGAFLDSTLDRIEEGIVLTAVAWRFAEPGDAFAAAACVFASSAR